MVNVHWELPFSIESIGVGRLGNSCGWLGNSRRTVLHTHTSVVEKGGKKREGKSLCGGNHITSLLYLREERKKFWLILVKGSSISTGMVHVPRRRRKRRQTPKLWFVLELVHDERTDPSMYHSTEGLVRSSQSLSWTNEKIRLRVRFRLRPGTRTAYKSNIDLIIS